MLDTKIDLRRLKHLTVLAEELNFARAAERVHLSQAAFSRSIQLLEEELNLRLFDRSTRSVQITTAGRGVLQHARVVLFRVKDLSNEAALLSNAQGGELSIGLTPLAVDGVMKGVLPDFRAERPHVQLTIHFSRWTTLVDQLQSDIIEFFVGFPGHISNDPAYLLINLPPQKLSIYCRRSHPLLASAAITNIELTHYPLIGVQFDSAGQDRLRQILGLPPEHALPIAMTCDSQALLREAVLNGDSILITWESAVADDLANGTMIDIYPRLPPLRDPAPTTLPCAIVTLRERTLSPAAQALIKMIVEANKVPA